MAWFFGGGSLSLEHHIRSTPTAFPFYLCNTAVTISHLVAQRMVPPPTNDEFVGVIEHIMESFHDLWQRSQSRPLTLTPAGEAIVPLVDA